MMIGIIDYGVGNLFSLRSSFEAIGAETFVSGDAGALAEAEKLILPGVGAFGDAAEKLRMAGLDEFVRRQAQKGVPLLGICLGMQLLFEKSFEYGEHPGLGLLKGQVVPMKDRLPEGLKIPHMGWNALHLTNPDSRLFAGTKEGEHVYFVHSFTPRAAGILWQPPRSTASPLPLPWSRGIFSAVSSTRKKAATWDFRFCAHSARWMEREEYGDLSCH